MKLLSHELLTSSFTLAKDYEERHTFTPMGCVSGAVDLCLERGRRPALLASAV